MKIAIISDIHGNPFALDTVLADLDDSGADRIICLGDVAAFGPQPAEVISRLRERRIDCIQGNTDEWLLHPLPKPETDEQTNILQEIELWGAEHLGAAEKSFLAGLPQSLEVPLENGMRLQCWHASPVGNAVGIEPDTPNNEIEERLRGQEPDLLAVGHTHHQLFRSFERVTILNPGSVGLAISHESHQPPARYTSFAEYAFIRIQGKKRSISYRRIPYPLDDYLAEVRRSGMPRADQWAERFIHPDA